VPDRFHLTISGVSAVHFVRSIRVVNGEAQADLHLNADFDLECAIEEIARSVAESYGIPRDLVNTLNPDANSASGSIVRAIDPVGAGGLCEAVVQRFDAATVQWVDGERVWVRPAAQQPRRPTVADLTPYTECRAWLARFARRPWDLSLLWIMADWLDERTNGIAATVRHWLSATEADIVTACISHLREQGFQVEGRPRLIYHPASQDGPPYQAASVEMEATVTTARAES